MTRMPGALWHPIPSFTPGNVTRPPMGQVTHTAVSPDTTDALMGVVDYIANPANQSSSYFVCGIDGTIVQCIDLADEAWTQMAGNRAWIGVENVGDGTREGLTQAQMEANARIFAWLHQTYPSIPLALTHNPLVGGLGYHGMGAPAWGHAVCLPLDITEVLTPGGWLPLADVTMDTEIASWAPDSGLVEFARPVGLVAPQESPTITIGDVEMTPDHRVYVYENQRGVRRPGKFAAAQDVAFPTCNLSIPTCGQIDSAGLPISADLLRLLVWVQADGHYQQKHDRLDHLHFHFAKERKVERVEALLASLGKDYRLSRRADGTTVVKVYGVDWLRTQILRWLPEKRWTWEFLNMNADQFAAFIAELPLADGSRSGGQTAYHTAVGENADIVQAICVTHGQSAAIGRGGRVAIHARRSPGRSLRRRDATAEHYDAREAATVGCVTTHNETILTRQRGIVRVVGNCPGTYVIGQLPTILAYAVALVNGTPPAPQEDPNMSRMVAHDEAPGATITLNDDAGHGGTVLVAMGCHPWDVDGSKITAITNGQIFHFNPHEHCVEIVSDRVHNLITCRMRQDSGGGDTFPTIRIAHGHVA